MSNINEIVDVQIAIEAPPLSTEAFSRMLLVVPKPTLAGTSEMSGVISIRQARELTDFGYAATSEAYQAAQVAFSQNPGPSLIYLIARQTVEESNEAISVTLDRAMEINEWYGVCLVGFETVADLRAAADWCEANKKLFGFAWSGTNIPLAINSYNRTFAIYSGETGISPMQAGNTYQHVGLMAKCFGYEPGSETWAHKEIATAAPSKINSAKILALQNARSNYYIEIANQHNSEPGNVGSGEWIDTIRLMDWLLVKVQEAVYGFIHANKKVPFNDDGITGIQNQVDSVLKQAQINGGIDVDRYDDNGEVEKGYEVFAPKASNISASDRRSRKLYGMYFIARLASATHFVQIRGTLVY